MGNVQNYAQNSWDLVLRIPSMSQAVVCAAFTDGLKQAIQQQISPHVTTLAEAQTMVAKVDLHPGQGSQTNSGSSGGASGSNKKVRGGKAKGKGHLGVVDDGKFLGESAYVLVEEKKLARMQKKNKVMAKKLQQHKKKTQGKQLQNYALCEKEDHFFQDFPDMTKMCKITNELGNALVVVWYYTTMIYSRFNSTLMMKNKNYKKRQAMDKPMSCSWATHPV